MDVVALSKGKYRVMRVRGDAFELKDKADFSKRWMAKAGTPEAKEALRDAATDRVVMAQDMIDAEEASATGRADKAEIKRLRARVAELEKQLDEASAPSSAKAKDEEPDEDEDNGSADDDSGADEEEAKKPAKTRRRRTRA